jgi:hypothetical protein
MLIRFKWWQRECRPDGTYNHAVQCPQQPGGKAVFTYANQGICDVVSRSGIEFLLKNPYNYEVAYEHYGISFDTQGMEVKADLPPEEAPLTAPLAPDVVPPETPRVKPAGKPRGRPPKRR